MNLINIPKPCNENWSEMSPTERGAFCNKCQIDVVDFSNMKADEIKTVLLENKGKHLCGRFKKSQIELINDQFIEWDNQPYPVFQSKFIYACLLVFGMTLFSCENTEEHVLGEIEPIENYIDSTAIDTVSNQIDSVHIDSTKTCPDEHEYLKGDVEYIETIETIQPEEKEHLLGAVMIDYNENPDSH